MKTRADPIGSHGFSLIETVIYVGLFTLCIGGLVIASYMFFETSERNQTKAMLQEEKNFVSAKIKWTLSGAKTINLPAIGASGSTLSALNYDGTTHVITLSGTDIKLGATVLNNSNVLISRLVFMHTYAGGTNPESVEAGFTITSKTPDGKTVSEEASTTGFLRN